MQNINVNPRCSPCFTLIKQKLEKYNPKDLRKLANKYKTKRRKKDCIKSELLLLNHLIL